MAARKVWRIPGAGNLADLRLEHEDHLDAPLPGQVTVQITEVGLNFADLFACLGYHMLCRVRRR